MSAQALIRAEIGLTGMGTIDELVNDNFEGVSACGDLCSAITEGMKVKVHGSCVEGLFYRLVLTAATLYAAYAIYLAVRIR